MFALQVAGHVHRRWTGELDELLDRHVEPMAVDMPEHSGVLVEGLLQLAGIAVGAPVDVELDDLGDGVSVRPSWHDLTCDVATGMTAVDVAEERWIDVVSQELLEPLGQLGGDRPGTARRCVS